MSNDFPLFCLAIVKLQNQTSSPRIKATVKLFDPQLDKLCGKKKFPLTKKIWIFWSNTTNRSIETREGDNFKLIKAHNLNEDLRWYTDLLWSIPCNFKILEENFSTTLMSFYISNVSNSHHKLYKTIFFFFFLPMTNQLFV